jgi:hypothetical protein
MSKNFPSDFYVACATVIPVLFLALIVQGGTYESLLQAARRAAQQLPRRNREFAITMILPLVAQLTILCTLTGEVFALLALYLQQDSRTINAVVMLTTLELLFAVTAVPVAQLWRTDRAITRQRLIPVVNTRGAPRFGYGAGARPLWNERDRDAEQIRITLRDAGHREFSDRRGGFVVEGGGSGAPFLVACTFMNDAAAAKETISYIRTLNGAAFQVRTDPDDERILEVQGDRRE